MGRRVGRDQGALPFVGAGPLRVQIAAAPLGHFSTANIHSGGALAHTESALSLNGARASVAKAGVPGGVGAAAAIVRSR